MATSKSNNIVLYVLLTLSYFFSYFFRVSTSVVLPIIQNEWELSTSIVGFISSMYFYTYAFMQPLSGVLNDKYGPSRIVGIGIIITTLGSLIFGFGDSVFLLIIGRLLMGIGLSPMLSGLLVYQSRAFNAKNYAFISGLSMMIGNFGAVVSVAPLSYALTTWERSIVFGTLSGVTFCIAICLFLFREKSIGLILEEENFKTMFKKRFRLSFIVIKRSNELRIIILSWLIIFGALMAFQGLWATIWFKQVYPQNQLINNIAATMVGVGVMFGNLFSGSLCKDAKKRSKYIKYLTMSNLVAWIFMVLSFSLPLPIIMTVIISTVLGFINGMVFVQFTAAVNEISPIGQGGAVFGLVNCFTFTSVIVFQWGTGVLIEKFSKSVTQNSAFILIFTMITVLLCIPIIGAHGLKYIRRIDNGYDVTCEARYSPSEK